MLSQEDKYFSSEFFSEFNIDNNNCELFVNRCILSLDFSEHIDWKEKKKNRVFKKDDFELINEKLDKLASGQLEVQIINLEN